MDDGALASCTWEERKGESQGHVQLLPKASDKLRPSIRDDRLQNSMQT
jgi:hypothetical protein